MAIFENFGSFWKITSGHSVPKNLKFQIRPAAGLPPNEAPDEDDCDVDMDEEEDERVLVINHRENETASPEVDEDSGREDSA